MTTSPYRPLSFYQVVDFAQFTVIFFFLTFFLGQIIDTIFPNYNEESGLFTLILEVIIQLIMIVTVSYHVRKVVVNRFPLLFTPKDRSYEKNSRGESDHAAALASAIMYIAIQKNFLKKVDRIKNLSIL